MIVLALLLLSLRTADTRHAVSGRTALRNERTTLGGEVGETSRNTGTQDSDTGLNPNQTRVRGIIKFLSHESDPNPIRIPRGAKDGSSTKRDQQSPHNYLHPRPHDPDGYFTTPRGEVLLQNPLYPVTESSYGAYAVMLLALILFAVGIVGNLALMCIVWHNYYLKTTWNCILASLAFWDFLVLFFCLPVVVFNELTTKRLLGDLSCRIVPYMEVTSLGVATFSLCALSIDRFHAATTPRPLRTAPRVEPCQSILAKLSVIWLGSLVLAAPELLLWRLRQEDFHGSAQGGPPSLGPMSPAAGLLSPRSSGMQQPRQVVDMCVRQPSMDLPESVYSLVLTYHEARMWWYFGCYFCLPLLFTLACQLVTRHVVAHEDMRKQGGAGGGRPTSGSTSSSSSSSSSCASPKKKKKQASREQRLSSTVVGLAVIYATCNLPENVCNIALAYISVDVSPATEALLALIGQFLLFVRCSATPVLLLCLCRSLGQAFMDCCCCCCEECLPDGASSSSSSASTTATAASTSPSALSSPISLSPSSPILLSTPSPISLSPTSVSPCTSRVEKLKIVSGTSPTIYYDKAKESSSVMAIGTPC